MSAERLKDAFFRTGAQYYVVGRFSAFASFLPITGNLFHHAVELFIKGYFAPTTTPNERKAWGHNLKSIWSRFKGQVADPTLARFDATIAELHKFEDIRYPERLVKQGMIAGISYVKPTGPITVPGRTEPTYEIVLEEVDELVRVMFEKSSRSPIAFMGDLGTDASTYLERQNKVPFKTLKK